MERFELETERLRLRPWTLSDEDVAAAFAMYGDPETTRFLAHTSKDLDDQRAHLARILQRERARRPGEGVWAVEPRAGGPAFGTAALKPLQESREIEVGWHLARSAWGNGYATEAGRALVRHGFETLRLPRIVAVVHPANVASVRVVERLGMRPIGRGRHYGQRLLRFELLADDPRG